MKYIMLCLLLCSIAFAADKPLTITSDNTTTPPTCVISVNVPDASAACAAQLAAIDAATKANAVPNAVQKDPVAAGKMAYAAALIPAMYKMIESVQQVATLSDADIDAKAATEKAAADLKAATLKAMRPDVK